MSRSAWYALGLLAILTSFVWNWCGATRSEAAPRIPDTVETTGLKFVTPPTQQAINRGLAFLAAQQNADGSFGANSLYRHNVAVTALAGMAFLANGDTPGRGQYGAQVEKSVGFILSASGPSGFIHVADSSSHGPMYGHGFATLFLAEVYGMTKRPDIRPKLELAVKVIVSSQNREGGWRYDPVPPESADISVTVCQIMALRSARNCGIFVPKETIDLCTQYVQKCQNPDGGFKYQLQTGSPSMFARSAAGIVALYSAGIYEGRAIEKGLNYLTHHTPHRDGMRMEPHYFYGQYYAVQGMWQAGGHFWNKWYPAIRDELMRRQLADGSWQDPHCSEYGTAMACIVLQMPNNYLPIFQR